MFSVPTLLLPSGRACISAVLKINNISRENIVWAPKWSSHCVWNNITYFSTPSINLKDHPNVFLNVHKWGYTHYLNTEYDNCEKCIVIEDSVDSLIYEKYALFPNNGDYEIISLNKVIASYSGGLLICKSSKSYEAAKKLQNFDLKLGFEQSRLKYLNCLDSGSVNVYNNWHYHEFENYSMDINSIRNIEQCLKNYELNIATSQARLKMLRREGLFDLNQDGRIPTQAVLKVSEFKNDNANIITRMMNSSRRYDGDEIYEKHYLLPLHFGVEQNIFDEMVAGIRRC